MAQNNIEKTYPEIKLKKMRASLGLTLAIVSGAIFSTLPFYGPNAEKGQGPGIIAYVLWLLPISFFVIFLRARGVASFVKKRIPLIRSENARPLRITLFLANFTVRSGRGFAYRIVMSPFAGLMPMQSELVKPLAEGGEFVYTIGYSEKGGDPVDIVTGKKIFGGIRIKPVFRRFVTEATAYYRTGSQKPFFIETPEGYRFWVKDE
jgi:hypothetical protein